MSARLLKAITNPRAAVAHIRRLAHPQADAMRQWASTGYAAPSPHHVKQAAILRNGLPAATWVETGTYKGDTAHLLSGVARKVYTIEPAPGLFAAAAKRFAGTGNVEVLHGTSETVLPELLPRMSGDVCFWLDGHYSAGETFQGEQDTPIGDELQAIAQHLPGWRNVVVMIDDIRLFHPDLAAQYGYPTLDSVVDWARAHGMKWHIEHDILFASR